MIMETLLIKDRNGTYRLRVRYTHPDGTEHQEYSSQVSWEDISVKYMAWVKYVNRLYA